MSSHPVAIVRAVYDAIGRGDTAAIAERFAPEICITQTTALPWGGEFNGHAGFGQFIRTLREHIDSRVEVDSVFEAGEDVVVTGRSVGQVKRTGAPFAVNIAHVLTVRGGKIVEVRYFIDTPAMLTALRG